MSNLEYIRKQGLDKFYTKKDYAKTCIDKTFELYRIDEFTLIIEPSAGNGNFYEQILFQNKIGIDIEPENQNLVRLNFFDYKPDKQGKILVIGNPPFGKVSSLAIKFFNHAAEWADVIAFIIPKTFRKQSVIKKLDKRFHLVYDEDTPQNPCVFQPKMMVKCCFQVWEKRNKNRKDINIPTTHNDWEYVKLGPLDNNNQPTPPTNVDFALRAYGGKIGHIETEDLHLLRPKSWHWIKSNIDKNILISTFKSLDYSNSLNTARQNSMGKSELVKLYSDYIKSHPL
tara:strand:- start:112 stop:963 length:852 start_codon:yes stop_codon:yes gene_type:complete